MRLRIVILVMLMIVVMATIAQAGTLNVLSGATTTGPGSSVWVKNNTAEVWACDALITGSPTAVTVRMEGNQGGELYDPTGMGTQVFSAAQLTAGIASFSLVSVPIVNIRANVVTLTGGTSPTVSVKCGGRP